MFAEFFLINSGNKKRLIFFAKNWRIIDSVKESRVGDELVIIGH